MRFTFISVTLLALAHSLAPGVLGAPTLTCDVQQIVAGIVANIPGATDNSPLGSLIEKVMQSLGPLFGLVCNPLGLRAVTSPAFSAPSTTTNVSLPTGSVSNSLGVSSSNTQGTSQAPSTSLSRTRRQLPTPLPINPTALAASLLAPLESVVSSLLAAESTVIKPTKSKPGLSASQA